MAVAFSFGKGSVLLPAPESIDDNYLSINEAREAIKTNFVVYRQMLDKKELQLLSELDQLEAMNKTELIQVRNDLQRFKKLIPTLDDSLDTNTLKPFLEAQKSLLDKQISHFERSQKLLTHVTLEFSTLETSVDKVINIVPFLSKSKFRDELQSLLALEPQVDEEWYLVTQDWFSTFTNSINFENPQTNDSWEFPESIPVDHNGIYPNEELNVQGDWKLLHSKAWDLLLRFNGMSPGSAPIQRKPFFNEDYNEIQVPILPKLFNCVIGHNCNDNACSKFSIGCQLETFPSETYQDILDKLSAFSKLYTNYPPRLFCIEGGYNINCNANYTKYDISKLVLVSLGTLGFGPYNIPSTDNRLPTSIIGLESHSFLLIIPDSVGKYHIAVTPNKHHYTGSKQIVFW